LVGTYGQHQFDLLLKPRDTENPGPSKSKGFSLCHVINDDCVIAVLPYNSDSNGYELNKSIILNTLQATAVIGLEFSSH
jgi:hypothetical protein